MEIAATLQADLILVIIDATTPHFISAPIINNNNSNDIQYTSCFICRYVIAATSCNTYSTQQAPAVHLSSRCSTLPAAALLTLKVCCNCCKHCSYWWCSYRPSISYATPASTCKVEVIIVTPISAVSMVYPCRW